MPITCFEGYLLELIFICVGSIVTYYSRLIKIKLKTGAEDIFRQSTKSSKIKKEISKMTF